ncbi:hypothetical protein [Nocardioides ochotonae]|uniref:hypothetical protein n=1 Tax=Nocardioides ochotonae TaxID=2685869 RepID=UPI00140DE70B|nr:hypothetical protein [Nocardioides ochotonae]
MKFRRLTAALATMAFASTVVTTSLVPAAANEPYQSASGPETTTSAAPLPLVSVEPPASNKVANRATDTLSLYKQAGFMPDKSVLSAIAESGEYAPRKLARATSALVEETQDNEAPEVGLSSIRDAPTTVNSEGQTIPRGLVDHVDPWCGGSGADGKRVQIVYVREQSLPDRYAQVKPLLLNEARYIDDVFAVSSAKTGGGKRVRWVTDQSCNIDVLNVVLPDGAVSDSLYTMRRALENGGWLKGDRKYLFFADAPLDSGGMICGEGEYYVNKDPNVNLNDGRYAQIARVHRHCWVTTDGDPTATALHELIHTLGAVQPHAPHGSKVGHCADGSEVMCYADGTGPQYSRTVCPATEAYNIDCNNDDYFNTNPPAGSFLANNPASNIALSPFLEDVAPLPPAPAINITTSSAAPAAGETITFTALTAPDATVQWSSDGSRCDPPVLSDGGRTYTLRCWHRSLLTVWASSTSGGNTVAYASTQILLDDLVPPTMALTLPETVFPGEEFQVHAKITDPQNATWLPLETNWSSSGECRIVSRTGDRTMHVTLTMVCTGNTGYLNIGATATRPVDEYSVRGHASARFEIRPRVPGVQSLAVVGPTHVEAGQTVQFTADIEGWDLPSYNWASERGWQLTNLSNKTVTLVAPWNLSKPESDVLILTVFDSADGVYKTVRFPYTVGPRITDPPGEDTGGDEGDDGYEDGDEAHDTALTFATTGTYPTTMTISLRDRYLGRPLGGKTVNLEKRNNAGKYVTVKKILLPSTGTAKFTMPVTTASTFRVVFHGDRAYNASYSTTKRVTVYTKMKATKVKKNLKVTLRTGVSALARQPVILQRKPVGTGRWLTVKNYKTNAAGVVNMKPPAAKKKKIDYRWVYTGSDNYRNSVSNTLRF